MTAFVVINPRSAGGRTRKEWTAISSVLNEYFPHFEFAFTGRRGDATAMTRKALSEGHQEIIAVGGDGTINEAANGFFDCDGHIAPDAVLGFVTSGTGGDFRKTFGIQAGADAGLAQLRSAKVRPIDVRRIACLG